MGQSPGKQQKPAAPPEGKDDAPAMIEVQLRLEMDQKNATEPARSECLKINFKVSVGARAARAEWGAIARIRGSGSAVPDRGEVDEYHHIDADVTRMHVRIRRGALRGTACHGKAAELGVQS